MSQFAGGCYNKKVVKLSQQNIKPIELTTKEELYRAVFLLFRPNNVEKFPVKCGAKRIDPSRDLYIDYYNTFHQAALHLEALHCISLNFLYIEKSTALI